MPRSASVLEKADATVLAVAEPPTLSNFARSDADHSLPVLGGEAQEDLLARLEVAQQGRLVHADRVGDIGKGDLPNTPFGAECAGRCQDGVFAVLLGLWTAGPLKIRSVHALSLAQPRCTINETVFY